MKERRQQTVVARGNERWHRHDGVRGARKRRDEGAWKDERSGRERRKKRGS